jgi:hypothetical protein
VPSLLTWEDELQSPHANVQGATAPTLEDALKQSITTGTGGIYLTCWDGSISYDLLLDPDPHEDIWPDIEPMEELPIGTVVLYSDLTRRNLLPEEGLSSSSFLPYLQSYRGHMHWSKVLCNLINPLYAMGYTGFSSTRYRDDTGGDRPVQEMLVRGELPDIVEQIKFDGLCYLPAQRATPELLLSALEITGCSLQRLSNNGVFLTSEYAPYRYENNTAQRYLLMGEKCIARRTLENRPLTPEDIAEAKAYFQRAWTIFKTIDDWLGVRITQRYLSADDF